jgi:glycosyltransferase involved in cell wall biosynthesis
MRIAVNTRFLLGKQLEGYGYFIQETFKRIVLQHPEHEFIFFFDRPFAEEYVFAKNVTPVVLAPQARHPLLFKIWYDVSVPLALRKHKADVFVSPDSFCSLNTSVPQCLVLHDLTPLHYPKFVSTQQLWYYKRYLPKFAKKAKQIATVSEYSKKDIAEKLKISSDKIDVVYSATKEKFVPIDWQAREEIKNKYANGNEYFLFTGAIHPRKNVMQLLKAFSIFKKRQQSSMQLLLVGRTAWDYADILKKLETFKFRNDVKLLGYMPLDELANITAAAYAMVFPSLFEGFGVPIIEAMQCGVPVVTSNTSSMPEIGGDSALYADPKDITSIAGQMIRVYQDENLRNQMIAKGFDQAAQFSWDKTAELLWQSIMKAATN